MNNIYESIAKKYDAMSKTQQKIAAYILENKTNVAFLNVNKLSKMSGVSEASVIRFANFMGFKGYPQLQQELQESTKQQLSIKERLAMSYEVYGEKEAGIAEIFKEEMERIQKTMENLDCEKFQLVIDEILTADRIFIVCARSAASLGVFFHYYLNMVLGNVFFVTAMDGSEEAMSGIGENDMVIGLTFSRYAKKTVQLMEYAYKKGAVTMAVTDAFTSPVIKFSKYYFLAETAMPTYLDSFIAPLTLINAILTYVGREKNRELEQRLAGLEDMWGEFHVFE